LAYLAIPLVLAVVVAAERVLLEPAPRWIYPVLWVTVSVALLLQMVFLWGVAGLVTDTRQAKRLFPIFGAGGILGAVVGGLLTRPLATTIGAENLLVVWAAGLMVAVVLVRAASPRGRTATRRRRRSRSGRAGPTVLGELSGAIRFVAASGLLRAMAVAAVLISVLFYLLYLPYAQAASATFPDADELAGFFGLFWAGVTGVALLVSLFATNRILGRFGVAATVVALPVLYVVAFGVVAWRSTFVALVAIRFVMGVWLQAVALPTWESLTNVTPEERRDQVRAFLNGGPTQVGTALAGVVGLVGGGLAASQLAVTGIVLAVVTVVVAWRIRRSYTSALVAAIRAGRPAVFGGPIPGAAVAPTDAGAVATLIDAARTGDEATRRLAVSMLPPEHAVARAELIRRIDDPDPYVRVGAAASLAGTGEGRAMPAIRASLDDPDAALRRHAVDALATADAADTAALLARASSDPDPDVRAAAIRARAAAGDASAIGTAAAALTGGASESLAAADAIERFGGAALGATLGVLRDHPVAPAAVDALSRIDAGDGEVDDVLAYVDARAAAAEADAALLGRGAAANPWAPLLEDALRARARRQARAAFLSAAALGGDRAAIRTAVDGLDAGEPAHVADALEVLELEVGAVLERTRTRRLLALWEARPPSPPGDAGDPTRRAALREDPDPLIRTLARAAASGAEPTEEEGTVKTHATSTLERTLVLRSVPLFSGLEPADLHAVAAIAEDHAFAPGEHLATQDELGDDLHVIVHGAVHVEHGDPPHTFATRGEGDVIGELSLLSRSPRIASVVADTEVRTIRLGWSQFESIVRERPSVALTVMGVLADRLTESTREHEGSADLHA
ncbi:MAG TPA: HEAT repeat domain-containing protein, partial [Actinomycetota bacterium]